MIRKTSRTHFIAFIITIVLLVASDWLAFAQDNRRASPRPSPEITNQAEELFRNALLASEADNREAARRQLQEAMRLWVQMREPGKAGKAALQMADSNKKARRYQEALDDCQQALNVKALPGAVKANALNAIALIYSDLYLHDKAARFFNQALDQARSLHDFPAQTLALTGLANIYYQQGDVKKALSSITQALQFSSKGPAEVIPDLLYLHGQISQKQGLIEQAKGHFDAALAIYEKSGDVAGQVKVKCALSTLSLLTSQNQAALEYAVQAVKLAENQVEHAVSHADYKNARELQWRGWLSRARAECSLEQPEHALNSYYWAVNHFEGLWWASLGVTEASAIAFREQAQAAYREYIDLLIEQEQIPAAYELTEQAKARTALNFTGARRRQPASAVDTPTTREKELSQTIIRLRQQLLATGISRDQQAKLEKQLAEAEAQKEEALIQDEMARAKERLVWTDLIVADDMKKRMAQEHTTLAEFSLGESRSFLWLFTRGELRFAILPPRQEIEAAVKAYLEALATPPPPPQLESSLAKLRPQAEALFAKLFGQLSGQLEPGKPLIIVPDGLLHYLPFEALMREGRYLVEDHDISYAPSASMLVLLQKPSVPVDNRERMELFAVGDAIFDAYAKTGDNKDVAEGLSKRARQLLKVRGLRLGQLPRTRDEVTEIARLFPADRRTVLLGKAGTEEAVKREALRRYRRLHFATHSLINEASPFRSAVVLTPGENAEEDGMLEVGEISRLELDCDLAVVSACQTGRGQLLSGEGIVGLSRAFLYAGVRTVVVSFWNVSDVSTGQLMKAFYQHLSAGNSNAAALRKAKLQMLTSGKQTRHPYYWSSFVAVGKP